MKTLKLFHFLIITLFTGLIVYSPVLTAQESKEFDDSDITNAVETELWIDEVVDMNRITIETREGVVTFTGKVSSILAKERAEDIAMGIRGVEAIVNRIDVEPRVDRTDRELQQAVSEAMLRDPATESYEVKATAKDGLITLEGTVDSWQEKELASTVAKGVRGVEDVNNKIEVVFTDERPDNELEKEIRARLANDVRVDDYLIEVSVEDGEVILEGTVGSLAEKNRAVRDSWVSGVDLVDAEGLNIEWWARDEMRRESVYEKRPDAEVEEAVRAAFLYDPRVNSFNPEVEAENGTVILKGTVNNLKAKKAAEEDARNVFGVWRVKNRLKVQPTSIPTDVELKEEVEKALINDPYVDRDDVTIDVSYGRVYLMGEVNTSFEEFHAERVVETVGGVVAVINKLDYKYEWTWRADWEIKDNVNEQLSWSLFVDASDIEVIVDDGIVTLEGEVNNWSEYNAAEENAYEGGAKDVRNKLTVLHPYYGPYNQYPFWTHPLYK